MEDEKVRVSYPTLTRRVRELELGKPSKARCDHVPDEPGVEMQHDTTVYRVKLADKPVRAVIASLLYLAVLEAAVLEVLPRVQSLRYEVFPARGVDVLGPRGQAVRDRQHQPGALRGSGKQAVIVPEMVAFADRYGFQFLCHAIRHPNRKAGEERSFWTVETNFLPGRSFQSLEDMNQQALEWATVRMEHRPASKTRLIPAKAFEHERHYLTELPAQLPAPYWPYERGTDEYGYVAVEGNYYWVPGTKRERRQGAALRGPFEDLSATDLRGRVPTARRRDQERPLQPRGTAAAPAPAQASPPRLPA